MIASIAKLRQPKFVEGHCLRDFRNLRIPSNVSLRCIVLQGIKNFTIVFWAAAGILQRLKQIQMVHA
jgi:hypothetical protein